MSDRRNRRRYDNEEKNTRRRVWRLNSAQEFLAFWLGMVLILTGAQCAEACEIVVDESIDYTCTYPCYSGNWCYGKKCLAKLTKKRKPK